MFPPKNIFGGAWDFRHRDYFGRIEILKTTKESVLTVRHFAIQLAHDL